MTVRSRKGAFARGGRRGASLLFCLLATLLVLVARPAAAMVLAPMCGGHGETLTAPPITRNAIEVPLAPSDCERQEDPRVETRAPHPAPPPPTSIDLVPRLPAIWYRLPITPRLRIPVDFPALPARPGHGRGIERPPR